MYLWVLLPDRGQKVVNEFADSATRVIYPSDELWDHLQPGVNVDGSYPIHQGLVYILQVSVVEPESQ